MIALKRYRLQVPYNAGNDVVLIAEPGFSLFPGKHS